MTRLRAEPLVSNEERDWRLMQEGVGRTAQEPLTHAGVAIGSHYDEIGFEAASLGDQSCADIAVAHPDAMKDDIDLMMLEVRDRVDSQRCLEFYWRLIIDDHDGHLFCLVHIWERLRQRAC